MDLTRSLRGVVSFNQPGEPGGGGGPAVVDPGGNANPGSTGTPPATGAGSPPAVVVPAQAPGESDEAFERRFNERIRRDGYVPRHAATRMSSHAERLQAQLVEEQRKTRALAGLEPQPDPEDTAVRSALARMYPHIAETEALEKLIKFAKDGMLEQLIETQNGVWGQRANEAGIKATAVFAELAGVTVDKLPPKLQQRMGRQLRDFILEDETGDRERRYNRADDSLFKEFAEDVFGTFVSPFRQQQQQVNVGRVETARRLPSQGPRAGVPPVQGGGQRLDRKAVGAAARAAVAQNMPDN